MWRRRAGVDHSAPPRSSERPSEGPPFPFCPQVFHTGLPALRRECQFGAGGCLTWSYGLVPGLQAPRVSLRSEDAGTHRGSGPAGAAR
jgi:hypothetical protein